MRRLVPSPFLAVAALAAFSACLPSLGAQQPARPAEIKPPKDYPVKPVPFTAVRLNDVFWAPRIETNRRVSIPFAFQKCQETGRVALFERAADRGG